jgi:hypothetical protein
VLDDVGRAAHTVSTHSFVAALRPALLLPIALLLVGILFAAMVATRDRGTVATPADTHPPDAVDEKGALPGTVS